jgi:hypothetical protein
MRQTPTAYANVGVLWRHGTRRLAALSAALVLALAGCSSFNPPPAAAVDPNIYPANYKAALMTFLQTNAYGMVGAISAQLSAPVLRPFGTENRYVACLNATGADWHKEKMVVYFGGEINQFVDATEEACKGAAFAPFPELPAMLAQIRSKQK